MKLATLKEGGRDGTLAVVSADLSRAVRVGDVAPTLQIALDSWASINPRLQEISKELSEGQVAGEFAFDPALTAAPLPRAYQWSEASVYLVHLERCRGATNREVPPSLYTEIGMYQGGSDNFLGPCDPIPLRDSEWDLDLEAGVCVITDDVPMGVSVADAASHIKLVLLTNDVSLRRLQPAEMAKGLGVLQCKPANAFSPVAVTPDSLGALWTGAMLACPVTSHVNGVSIGSPRADVDAYFEFPQLIAHLARTRHIAAGSIIGAGTVANRDEQAGVACLLEKRAIEILREGSATTPFLTYGDRVRIECVDPVQGSLFGAIDQVVARYAAG